MTIYQKNIRENLINQGVHLNDDTDNYNIGQANPSYDLEERQILVTKVTSL